VSCLIFTTLLFFVVTFYFAVVLVESNLAETTQQIETLIIDFNKGLFNSKASLVSNAFQCFINDININTILIEAVANGRIKQRPAQMQQRNTYHIWQDVLHN
jgi:hypothetical protein